MVTPSLTYTSLVQDHNESWVLPVAVPVECNTVQSSRLAELEEPWLCVGPLLLLGSCLTSSDAC